LNNVAQQVVNSPYLLEVLSRKATEIYVLGDYSSTSTLPLKKLIGSFIAHLRGDDEQDRKRITGRVMQKAERKALLQRIKVERDGDS